MRNLERRIIIIQFRMSCTIFSLSFSETVLLCIYSVDLFHRILFLSPQSSSLAIQFLDKFDSKATPPTTTAATTKKKKNVSKR